MKPTRRRSTRVASVVVLAALGVAACESQPSARRVARDMVETLAADDEAVRDCMLEVVDSYSKDELQEIGEGIRASNTERQAESAEALERFERDLSECR